MELEVVSSKGHSRGRRETVTSNEEAKALAERWLRWGLSREVVVCNPDTGRQTTLRLNEEGGLIYRQVDY